MLRPLALALALVTTAASAQTVRSADVVEWRVRAERGAPGGEARIVLDAEIGPGWRLYAADSPVGRPLAVDLDALPAGVEPLALRQGTPQRGYDEGFESAYTYFAERARIVRPLRIGGGAAAGEHEVTGAVRFAVCNDSVCLAPSRLAFRVPLVVE